MSTSETGFEKNLSLYEQMITELEADSENYTPPIEKLSIDTLKSNVAPLQAALDDVNTCLADYTFAVNERQADYTDMEKRITQVNDLLPLLGVETRTIADMKSVYDKVKGYSSNSEQGFDHLKKNFDSYLAMLKKISIYRSNEPTLTIEALTTLSADLEIKNKATSTTDSAVSSARRKRNELMYNEETGIVPLCKNVKQYYKVKEGVNGAMYQRLVALLRPMR